MFVILAILIFLIAICLPAICFTIHKAGFGTLLPVMTGDRRFAGLLRHRISLPNQVSDRTLDRAAKMSTVVQRSGSIYEIVYGTIWGVPYRTAALCCVLLISGICVKVLLLH